MNKTLRPLKLTLANVGRLLTAAGEARAVWHKSSRVRGWGRWSAGFTVEDVRDDKSALRVRYICERKDAATEYRLLDQWRIILARRFHVSQVSCSRDGEYLLVCQLAWEDVITPDAEARLEGLAREGG